MSGGVWAYVVRGNYEGEIEEVFPEEIDALRHLNEQGYGSVELVEWRKTWVETDKTE